MAPSRQSFSLSSRTTHTLSWLRIARCAASGRFRRRVPQKSGQLARNSFSLYMLLRCGGRFRFISLRQCCVRRKVYRRGAVILYPALRELGVCRRSLTKYVARSISVLFLFPLFSQCFTKDSSLCVQQQPNAQTGAALRCLSAHTLFSAQPLR